MGKIESKVKTSSVFFSERIESALFSYEKFPTLIILLALFIEFIKPQQILSFLSPLRIPLLMAVISCGVWIPRSGRNWEFPTKLFACFLFYLLFYIFIGKFVFDDLIRNDGRARWSFFDLCLASLGLGFPIASIFVNKRSLIELCKWLSFIGCLLGVYAITHAGTGPGGWIEDENDCCFALLMLFPFSVASVSFANKTFKKLIALVFVFFCVIGILGTLSRGGFVGFVLALLAYLYYSPKKFQIIIAGIFFLLAILPFVPREYYREISSISNVNEGTAMQR